MILEQHHFPWETPISLHTLEFNLRHAIVILIPAESSTQRLYGSVGGYKGRVRGVELFTPNVVDVVGAVLEIVSLDVVDCMR